MTAARFDLDGVVLWTGDARTVLAQMPPASVDCVVMSPPYWRQRDYGVAGQPGLENALDGYVTELAGVFDHLARVLKPTGTCWLNLGDSYTSAAPGRLGEPGLLGGVAAGAMAAAVVAWRVGHVAGLSHYRHVLRTAGEATAVKAALSLHATGVIVAWPLIAVVAFGLLEALDPTGRESRGRARDAGGGGAGQANEVGYHPARRPATRPPGDRNRPQLRLPRHRPTTHHRADARPTAPPGDDHMTPPAPVPDTTAAGRDLTHRIESSVHVLRPGRQDRRVRRARVERCPVRRHSGRGHRRGCVSGRRRR